MWLANSNALVWAFGNGLVSTALVTFLALNLGAEGLEISWILAAPHLAGVLRLFAPALMTGGEQRKLLCLVCFWSSGLVLVAMPLLAAPRDSISPSTSLTLLIVCWCIYHLLEYVAVVALWSWLGDWMPPPVRGSLIGWRERFLVVGRIVGIGASILLAAFWKQLDPNVPFWMPLSWSAFVGAKIMILAVVPLIFLGATTRRTSIAPLQLGASLFRVMFDREYRGLLFFSCWLALANGLTGSPQYLYAKHILGFGYENIAALRSMMYAGQTAIAPACGRWIDRFGATRLMTFCQLLVATGPLFYLFATPEVRWCIAGAYVVWMFYAPINVGIDVLKLKLAPQQRTGPSLALYYTLGDLSYAASAIVAGYFYDTLKEGGAEVAWLFATFFIVGWIMRSLAAVLVWRIRE